MTISSSIGRRPTSSVWTPSQAVCCELRYANEVIRQHLHEWLRFSRALDMKGSKRRCLRRMRRPCGGTWPGAWRVQRQPLPCPPSFRQNLSRRRRARAVSPTRWLPSFNPSLVRPDSDAVFAVCANASRTGAENSRKYIQKLSAFAQYLEERRRRPTQLRHARARSGVSMKTPTRWTATLVRFHSSGLLPLGLRSGLGGSIPRRCGPTTAAVSACQPSGRAGQTEVERILAAVNQSTPSAGGITRSCVGCPLRIAPL